MMKFTNQVLAYEEVQNRIKYKLARRQICFGMLSNMQRTCVIQSARKYLRFKLKSQNIELLLDFSNHLKDQIFKGIYDDDWRGEDD